MTPADPPEAEPEQRTGGDYEDRRREIVKLVANDDTAVALLQVTGTNIGARGTAPPTGRRIRFTVCNIIELDGGRVRTMRQIYDSADLARQLG